MPELPEPPAAARPGDAGPARPFDVSRAAIGVTLAIVAGTALLGLAAGYAWSLAAPRALLVIVSHGAAGLVAGGLEAFATRDQRRRRGGVGTPLLAGPGGGQAWSPGPQAGRPWPAPGIPGGQPRLD